MKKTAQWGCLVLAVALAGCAPSNYVVVTPLGERPPGRPSLAVGEIVDALPSEVRPANHPKPESLARLQTILREDLAKLKSKAGGGDFFSSVAVADTAVAGTEKSLVLTGKILSFRPGSRAARYFIGFGAGKSELVVQLSLREAGHTEDLFVGNFKGQITGGFFGGSDDQPLREVSTSFTRYLKDKWRP